MNGAERPCAGPSGRRFQIAAPCSFPSRGAGVSPVVKQTGLRGARALPANGRDISDGDVTAHT